jgi:hypothetical protein
MPKTMTSTRRFTRLATGLGLFMIFLGALIVNVALPQIQADFPCRGSKPAMVGGRL